MLDAESYVFDLDGTIYLGDALLPGAVRLIQTLRDQGRRVVYCSNNPTRRPEEYAAKLTRLGLPTPASQVVTSLTATVAWVVREMPGAAVFAIGEQPLRDALVGAGLQLCDDPARIDLVVASYDRTFDYRKLQIAFDALWFHRRARLVATNPDRYCPFPGGRGEPDAACVIAAVEAGTGVRCEAVFGKPSPDLLQTIIERTGLDPATSVMVGDRLTTDVGFARATGMMSALVLTGDTSRADLAAADPAVLPDLVLTRVDELLDVVRVGTTR
jgi:HAD superfamily hydrolase (TIGR01450 family)